MSDVKATETADIRITFGISKTTLYHYLSRDRF